MRKNGYKILYHHRTLADGAEGVHIREMVRSFRNTGHIVYIDALYPTRATEENGSLKSRIIKKLRWKLPQSVYEFLQVTLNFYTFYNFYRQIRAKRPQLVYKRHSQFDIGPILAAKLYRIPVILEANSCFSSFESLKFEAMKLKHLGRWIERQTFLSSDIIFAVSSPLKRKIVQLGIPDKKVIVLPNGANYKKFDPAAISSQKKSEIRRKYGIQNDSFLVGFVGSLREWHGIDFLLNVFAKLVREHPEMILLIVGDGPIRHKLFKLTEHLGISEKVIFTGNVEHDEIPVVVSFFDVAVLPAEYRHHASPMKILEYMAMEKIVIAPDMENIRNIIDENKNGILFKAGDEQDLLEKLKAVYQNYSQFQSIGKQARQKIVNQLNWDNNARKVIDITLNHLGKNGK